MKQFFDFLIDRASSSVLFFVFLGIVALVLGVLGCQDLLEDFNKWAALIVGVEVGSAFTFAYWNLLDKLEKNRSEKSQ